MSVPAITEAQQYLTFRLGEETFALEVAKVREILDFTPLTKVPRTPDFMRGVINLRGGVVPVVDLRLKFDLSRTEKTINTCIIVVEVTLDGTTTLLGALSDSVQEVFDLAPEQIESPPRLGNRLKTDFLKGMGKRNEQFVMILDIDKVFSCDELEMARQAQETAA